MCKKYFVYQIFINEKTKGYNELPNLFLHLAHVTIVLLSIVGSQIFILDKGT